jgi:hypothetical protein
MREAERDLGAAETRREAREANRDLGRAERRAGRADAAAEATRRAC